MARRASIATGNFTAAGTWGLIDATMYGQSETSAVVCPTAYSNVARSAQYTPGAITVSHIGVKLAVRTGTTGTITLHIADSAHTEVAGTAITINCADLPVAATSDANGGWHFFKLAIPKLLTAATLYEVEAQTSSASQISLFASAATNGLSCALLQAATTGAPAATDDLFVCGEYTGAGTSNSFTVTMDNTATTDFGSTPTAANSLLGPGIAICNKGTLIYGTTAATNYYLKESNSIIVYSGGVFNIGTTGTPIPRNSTAVLEFDSGADGDYGLTVRNLGTFTAQGLSRTSGKNIVSCKLNTDEAAAQTVLGVDTDTGWLNADDIVIAATTRTASQTEKRTLSGNANASDMTVSAGLTNAHSGTSPTQAEVILLTRNVKIRGVSGLMSYMATYNTSTVDLDWVEFRYLGENASPKRGIEIANTNGLFNMQYCSLYDFEDWGLYCAGTTSAITVSNNVFYNLDTAVGANTASINIASNSSVTFTNNICLLLYSATLGGIEVLDGDNTTFTGNTVIGGSATVAAIRLNRTAAVYTLVDKFINNTVHSSAGAGITIATYYYGESPTVDGARITFSGLKAWRCTGIGLTVFSLRKIDLYNCLFFGNTTTNFSTTNLNDVFVLNCEFYADTSFATTNGVTLNTAGDTSFKTCLFGTAAGIYTTHTNDINLSRTNAATLPLQVKLDNCKLSSGTEVVNTSTLFMNDFIGSQRHDQTNGLHKTWKGPGICTIETTTVQSGGQSIRMTPDTAAVRLEVSFKVAVANGATITPTVYVYEDASYNGSRARLVLKRNDALGITSDTVLDTATASSDTAWEALTGTTAAASDDGVMEFVVDCNGTAGNLFVDSFTVA